MRIALVDPLAYTPPYDHALANALAEEGHAVTLLTSRFPTARRLLPSATTARSCSRRSRRGSSAAPPLAWR